MKKVNGVGLISIERFEQIAKHGKTVEFDVENNKEGQLLYAASVLINNNRPKRLICEAPIGWDAKEWFYLIKKEDPIQRLSMAGALIAAELDRLLTIK